MNCNESLETFGTHRVFLLNNPIECLHSLM